MTDQELDRMMQRVLLDAVKRDCERETDDGPSFEPSPRYQRQITAMLADPLKWAHKRARPVWKKAIQKVAVILLVFSLSLGSLMAVSPTVRAAVIRWVTEWYEMHVTFRYSGEQISGEMPWYEITGLPEGYIEDESKRIEWPEYISFTFYNPNKENDQRIIFDYAYMSQGGAADFVTEDTEIISVTVNDLEGQLFLEKDWENTRSTLTWIDAERNLQFTLMAALNETDILHIAESVSLTELPKQN